MAVFVFIGIHFYLQPTKHAIFKNLKRVLSGALVSGGADLYSFNELNDE